MREKKMAERGEWEEQHPIEASQEFELEEYSKALRSALRVTEEEYDENGDEIKKGGVMNEIPREQWAEAEKQIRSLEAYVKEHKILAARIRKTGIHELLVSILKAFKQLDEVGIDREKIDVARAERIWGLADKIGSGLDFLVHTDRRRRAEDPLHTTRSIFLLKSAPPATITFAASPEEWRVKRLRAGSELLDDVVLGGDIQVADEQMWNVVFQELSELENVLVKGVTPANVKDSGIDNTLKAVSEKIRDLNTKRDEKMEGDLSLMYVSWELAMRIGVYFNELEN
jgi:hypothetical protein